MLPPRRNLRTRQNLSSLLLRRPNRFSCSATAESSCPASPCGTRVYPGTRDHAYFLRPVLLCFLGALHHHFPIRLQSSRRISDVPAGDWKLFKHDHGTVSHSCRTPSTTCKPRRLQSALWNPQFFGSKQEELLEFAERYKADVILVSETGLKNADIFNLPNFRSNCSDRPKHGGGVTILCRN